MEAVEDVAIYLGNDEVSIEELLTYWSYISMIEKYRLYEG